MSPNHRNTGEISSVGRAVQILRAFLRPSSRMTVEELVRRTDLPKTTVHRIVTELERLQVIERTATGLALGTAVFELGQAAPQARTLRDAARLTLLDLSHATRLNVGLTVLDHAEVVYVDTYLGRDAPQIPQRGGMRWPVHASCSGKAMLAHSTSDIVEEVLAAPLRALTPRTITDPEALRRELAEVRRRGAAFDRQESFRGVAGVAAPILVGDEMVGAVSISGVAGRINLPRYDVAARAAALTIARAMERASPGR